MSSLKQIQQQFIDVIKGEDPTEFTSSIVKNGQISCKQRVEIYCNAYYLRLKECIETDHEILAYYLGDDLFEKMVSAYIKKHPSQHTSLRYFCDQLPIFLTCNAPFKDYPVIAELARFERCLLSAFDAADSKTVDFAMLQSIAPELWPFLKFKLHPSVHQFDCHYNSVESWQMLKQKLNPPHVQKIEGNWLVWRNKERLTEFASLNIVELILLQAMFKGDTYGSICEQLADFISEQDIAQASGETLINWLNMGIISDFTIAEKASSK